MPNKLIITRNFQESIRPEYAAMAPTMEKNPITGVKEPYFPQRMRWPRIVSGIGVVIIMVSFQIFFSGECHFLLQLVDLR